MSGRESCQTNVLSNDSLKKAFTVLELAVVVGVIGILAALSGASLVKAKQRAKAVKCSSNLRQLSINMAIYVHDNGHYPEGLTPSRSLWLAFGGDVRALYPVMQCPSIRGGVYQPNFYGSGGYGHRPNLGLARDLLNGPLPESGIVAPSDMIGITDFVFPLFPPRVQHGGPDPGLPHSGGLQFALCDGHVEHAKAQAFTEATDAVRRRWNNDQQPHNETW